MSDHYKHFKTVVYIPAQTAASFDEDKLRYDHEFIEKFIGLDKVYLETHRGDCDVDDSQLKMIRDYLESKGVTVSGGITTTIDDFEGAEQGRDVCLTPSAIRIPRCVTG